jgi:hypothetical protein
LAHMSISTYLRPNIHQNGPEILGVNCGNFYILHFNSFCFKNILYMEEVISIIIHLNFQCLYFQLYFM